MILTNEPMVITTTSGARPISGLGRQHGARTVTRMTLRAPHLLTSVLTGLLLLVGGSGAYASDTKTEGPDVQVQIEESWPWSDPEVTMTVDGPEVKWDDLPQECTSDERTLSCTDLGLEGGPLVLTGTTTTAPDTNLNVQVQDTNGGDVKKIQSTRADVTTGAETVELQVSGGNLSNNSKLLGAGLVLLFVGAGALVVKQRHRTPEPIEHHVRIIK